MKEKTCKDKLKSYSLDLPTIKSNIIALDTILVDGFTPGSIVQFIAESAIGKTTIASHVALKMCKQDKKILYLDTEGSVTKNLLDSIGLTEYIDSNFFYVRESTFSKVESIIDSYIELMEIDFIIVDSIACLISDGFVNLNKSKNDNEKKGISITSNNTNINSRQLTMFLNKYNSLAKSRNITFIMINQYRNKVDLQVGTILKEFGGKNVRYNSDVIIRIAPLKSTGIYKDFKNLRKIPNGVDLEFEIIKSNKSSSGKRVPFYLIFGTGVSNVYSVIYALMGMKIITESNSYYSYKYKNVERKFHGSEELYALFPTYVSLEEHKKEIMEYYLK